MTDAIRLLADLGAASVDVVWMPVLAWTALALVAEGALRLARASARVGLGVRGALVALLPMLLAVPTALASWVPSLRPIADAPPIPQGLPREAVLPAVAHDLAPPIAEMVEPIPFLDVVLGGSLVVGAVTGLVALGVLIGGLLWLSRYRRTLGSAAAPVVSQAKSLADQLGVRREIEVVESEPQSSPFTVGWRRPVVAVPPDLGGEALRLALAHEIAHVRERHYGWSLAERFVRAAFVWHPLVHVVGRRLAFDRERTADAAVLHLWPDRARRYGRLLHDIAARPAPSLALAASSSTLIHRLTAMTRPAPDRRRLAGLASALVLAVPLLLAAAALPDARPASAAPPPPSETVDLPGALTEAGTVDDAVGAAPADTLDRYITTRQVDVRNGDVEVDLTLAPGTSRAVAEAIADDYSAGGEPGTLRVRYDGGTIERSTIRRGVVPPPPPPPPAAPGAPPAPPSAPPAPPAPAFDQLAERLRQMESLEDESGTAEQLRQQMATLSRALVESQRSSTADLERVVTVLEGELLAVERELAEAEEAASGRGPGGYMWNSIEDETRYIRLDTRRDLVRDRYRRAIERMERQRLDDIVDGAQGDG